MKLTDSLTGLQHIGIPCKDLAEAVAFYESLGFTNIYQTPNGDETVAFMEFAGLVIELYGPKDAVGKSGAIDHIALDCKDIDAAFALCKEQGYRIKEEVTPLPFWANGIKYFSILGPNEEVIEVCQKL